jgi:hypothetical protein
MKKISSLFESKLKTIRELTTGDYFYGIELPYQKNSTPKLIEGRITDIKINKDDNDYYGSSYIKFTLSNGKQSSINFYEREAKNSILNSGRSKFFTTKQERDIYYKEQTPNDIQAINREIEYTEQMKQKYEKDIIRKQQGKFNSLEEEIEYIKDEYDHEYGSKEENRKMNQEMQQKIQQAKQKWNK